MFSRVPLKVYLCDGGAAAPSAAVTPPSPHSGRTPVRHGPVVSSGALVPPWVLGGTLYLHSVRGHVRRPFPPRTAE
ncbi:hypothetical protein Z043_102544 [Scleropages formosus]|uniref:Uncharacterized protein n=1 Tax=Scleropages formosus TaxID=113540 RepID=A0A0P7ZAQ7_SCLFO|nr:hypothetical protein Z043_102544 [Scleropages formosus]